jgi:hypothetical protein
MLSEIKLGLFQKSAFPTISPLFAHNVACRLLSIFVGSADFEFLLDKENFVDAWHVIPATRWIGRAFDTSCGMPGVFIRLGNVAQES